MQPGQSHTYRSTQLLVVEVCGFRLHRQITTVHTLRLQQSLSHLVHRGELDLQNIHDKTQKNVRMDILIVMLQEEEEETRTFYILAEEEDLKLKDEVLTVEAIQNLTIGGVGVEVNLEMEIATETYNQHLNNLRLLVYPW